MGRHLWEVDLVTPHSSVAFQIRASRPPGGWGEGGDLADPSSFHTRYIYNIYIHTEKSDHLKNCHPKLEWGDNSSGGIS